MKAFEYFYIEKLDWEWNVLEWCFKNKKDMFIFVDNFYKSLHKQWYIRKFWNSSRCYWAVTKRDLMWFMWEHTDFVNIYYWPKKNAVNSNLPIFYLRIHPILTRKLDIKKGFFNNSNSDNNEQWEREEDINRDDLSDDDDILAPDYEQDNDDDFDIDFWED